MSQPAWPPLAIGDRVQLQDEWTVVEALSAGGFGSVYKVQCGSEWAALKVVKVVPGAARELLFEHLVGPHIMPMLDSGTQNGAYLLLMPLAEYSLRAYLEQCGYAPSFPEAIDLLTQIATALATLDGTVVHRDLKPENVLFLDGRWVLSDFGISKYAEATTAPDTRKACLTPPYAAPEQWRFETASSATDVYAFGVIAHEVLAGERPFPGPTESDYRDQHLHDQPSPLSVPTAISALVDECLYKQGEARPTSQNLLARLQRFATSPSAPGLIALQEANWKEVRSQAEAQRQASEAASEEARRDRLREAASQQLKVIVTALKDALLEAAPTATYIDSPSGGWSIRLGRAELKFSGVLATKPSPWEWQEPPFIVVAHASLTLKQPPSRSGYSSRSHSLWFGDIQAPDDFGWFECAFGDMALAGGRGNFDIEPYALPPGSDAAQALAPAMTVVNVRWPFTRLEVGALDDFIGRWAEWLAIAAGGLLEHPANMPERPVEGSWRR